MVYRELILSNFVLEQIFKQLSDSGDLEGFRLMSMTGSIKPHFSTWYFENFLLDYLKLL